MTYIPNKKETNFTRISEIVKNLIQEKDIYQERLDVDKMTNHIYNLFNDGNSAHMLI